ncbi:MAG: class I SAM-dependent methyltransferase [Candidatus Melainabacteria bacterium]|nr:class I SAM-dependent methyltransferase [Candidatus Melainabacteria bacterium]
MKIEGWLSACEAVALYKLIHSIDNENVTVCEIGSWLGKSSYVLACALNAHKNGKLFCVDPFNAAGDDTSKKIYQRTKKQIPTPLIEKFKKTMKELGVLDKIEILKGYSHKVIKNFNKPLDVLFIDGDHEYKAVLRDYKDWSKLIKKGGFIVFHDVGAAHTTGPKEVVELELVKNRNWTNHLLIDELYIAKKIK